MVTKGNGAMGRTRVEVELTNYGDFVMAERGALPPDQVRKVRLEGVVDSGANYLVLPKRVATQLGLPSAGNITVSYADKRKAKRPLVEGVQLELLGRHGLFKAIVEPRRTTALVGAIVLEDLDLLVDCTDQKLLPRDPNTYTAEVE